MTLLSKSLDNYHREDYGTIKETNLILIQLKHLIAREKNQSRVRELIKFTIITEHLAICKDVRDKLLYSNSQGQPSRTDESTFPRFFFFSTFFMGRSGKIRRLCWKKRLKISEIANFESDLLKSNIRYSSSEPRNFTKICTVGGYKLAPHPVQSSVNFCSFAELCRRSLQTYQFQTCRKFTNIKTPFPVVPKDFP